MYQTLLKSENSWLYGIVLLLEGYLTLSIEILAIRQLIPFVGNSVIATSLIIGIFLLALAFGYQKGGVYRAEHNKVLVQNFTKAFYLFGIGLSYAFIALLFEYSKIYLGLNQITILTLYLVLIIAPLVYLLGQTVPLIMGLLHNVSHTALISGFVLNISTIGSFFGALLTSMLLLNYFGVAVTIFINLLLLSALIIIFHTNKPFAVILMAGSLIIGYMVNINFEHNFFVKTNSYGNYRIQETMNKKYLFINESQSSVIDKNNNAAKYIEYIKKLLFVNFNLKNKEIAVLGAGGFTLTADRASSNNIVYIDIDPDIKNIVQKNGYVKDIHGQFVGADARYYLLNNQSKFDVIFSDAYSNRYTIPFHLLTTEHFKTIFEALKPEGLAVFNIIGSPLYKDKYTQSVDNSIRTVFKHCNATSLDYTSKYSNIIYVCFKSPNQATTVYSDNLNSAPFDMSFG